MNQDLITHYGRVRVANIRIGAIEPESVFTQRTTYVNNLPQEVKMRLRSGLVVSLPVASGGRRERNHSTGEYEFVIRREYVFLRENLTHVAHFLTTVTPNHSLELQQLQETFFKIYQNITAMQRDIRCVFEYYFSEEDIGKVGNVFYHHDLDTVFTYGSEVLVPNHPDSLLGQKDQMQGYAEKMQNQYGFVFMIELIDSLEQYGPRYVSICNQVFKIVPKKDNKKPDGIYIVSSKPTHGKISTDEIVTQIFEFGEAESQLGLYKKYELAKSYGDPNLQRKEELEQLQHANQLLKMEAAREKTETDRAMSELDRRNKELEAERQIQQKRLDDMETNLKRAMDWERMKLDEMFSQRQSHRKDTTEMIKYIPLALTAIGTILMAVKTFKTETTKS